MKWYAHTLFDGEHKLHFSQGSTMSPKKFNIPVKVGEELELSVNSLASSGDGITRYQDYALFLPKGLPGDLIKGKVVKTTPRFGIVEIKKTLKPSPHRINPPCKVFSHCGGCQLQNFEYEQQIQFKRQKVLDALEHIGKIDPPEDIITLPADPIYHYRNKGSFAVQYTKRNLEIGFFEQGSHKIADSPECDILLEPINRVKEWLRGLLVKHKVWIYNEVKHNGLLRGIMIRRSQSNSETLVGLITAVGQFPKPFLQDLRSPKVREKLQIVGMVQNINPGKTNVILGETNRSLYGQKYLTDRLGPLKFRISLNSFFQVNPFQTIRMYDLIKEWVGEYPGPVVDAYCGNGGISLWLAKEGIRVMGVDDSPASIADAKVNAQLNDLIDCQFFEGKIEEFLQPNSVLGDFQTLIVDPPRKGCSKEVIDSICQLRPERLIYVSCNPSTLARDLALLPFYQIDNLAVIDLFPQTHHIETVVNLKRI